MFLKYLLNLTLINYRVTYTVIKSVTPLHTPNNQIGTFFILNKKSYI